MARLPAHRRPGGSLCEERTRPGADRDRPPPPFPSTGRGSRRRRHRAAQPGHGPTGARVGATAVHRRPPGRLHGHARVRADTRPPSSTPPLRGTRRGSCRHRHRAEQPGPGAALPTPMGGSAKNARVRADTGPPSSTPRPLHPPGLMPPPAPGRATRSRRGPTHAHRWRPEERKHPGPPEPSGPGRCATRGPTAQRTHASGATRAVRLHATAPHAGQGRCQARQPGPGALRAAASPPRARPRGPGRAGRCPAASCRGG